MSSAIRARAILSHVRERNPVGVEVGVFRGSLSARLLEGRPDLTLHMVDPWAAGTPGAYADSGDPHAHMSRAEQDEHCKDATLATAFASGRRRVWRLPSVEGARQFQDGTLDFVFIDGDHTYEAVRDDIQAWLPKLKPGGLLCGHDYSNPGWPFLGVDQAVNEFAAASGLPLMLGENFTWFIRLPGVSAPGVDLLTVVCVNVGDKYPAEHVNILRAMVSRNLDIPHRFVCMTDDRRGLDNDIEPFAAPDGMPGWWAKLGLFRPGMFQGRVLYLDLDVCVTGRLEPLVQDRGIVKDWHLPGFNSSVIVWDGDDLSSVWTLFRPEDMGRLRGDQDWLNEVIPQYPTFPTGMVVDHLGAGDWPPAGAAVVAFHGVDKPDNSTLPWVPLIWSRDGMGAVQFAGAVNTAWSVMRQQASENMARALPWLKEMEPHDRTMVIVGGGPSLSSTWPFLAGDIFALNGAAKFLRGKGIVPKGHIILDARPENAAFVEGASDETVHYIASVCHPSVFDALVNKPATLWNPDMTGLSDLLAAHRERPQFMVCGGSTVGLKAMPLGHVLGYRRFHLHGFDSSHRNDARHAYAQDGEGEPIDVWVAGRKFVTSPAMFRQAQQFQSWAQHLIGMGCEIEVFGEGLLPWIARSMNPQAIAA